MVNSDGVTAPLPLTGLPNITTAPSTPPGGMICLSLISPGNLSCVDLALGAPGDWRELLHLPGWCGHVCDSFHGEELDLVFLALPTSLAPFSDLAARSPRAPHDLLESGDLFLSY